METESAFAITEVYRLSETIDSRDRECITIVNKQKDSFEKLLKARVDYSVLFATTKMQEKLSFEMVEELLHQNE